MIEPTDEMRRALRGAADGACLCNVCANHRVAAVLAIVDRDRCMEASGHVFHPLARPATVDPFGPVVDPCAGCDCAKAWHLRNGCMGDFTKCPCREWMPPELADEHHYDTACDDRPYCRIPEHHEADVLP